MPTLICIPGHQLCALVNKIRHSSTILLPAYKQACAEARISYRKIRLNCNSRWSSTYNMLRLALTYRTVLDDMTGNRTLRLRALELDNEDWLILDELAHVLKVRAPSSRMHCH